MEMSFLRFAAVPQLNTAIRLRAFGSLVAAGVVSAFLSVAPLSAAITSPMTPRTFANGASSNYLTIAKPITGGAIANGDVLVAQITFEKGSNISFTTVPMGWVTTPSLRVDNGTDIGQAIFYKVITNSASEPGAYQWVFSQTSKAAGGILVFTGVDHMYPVVASSSAVGTGGTAVAPSLAAEGGSALLGYFAVKNSTSITMAPPMMGRYQLQNIGNYITSAGANQNPVAAGATGPRTATLYYPSDKWVAQLVSLRAAVATQTPAP
jgi:hypothetical protein